MNIVELNHENWLFFAIKHYNNPLSVTYSDFEEDLKRLEAEMTNDGFILQDFLNDANKMKDFELLDKQEFLNKHPFVKEKEYNLTRLKQKEQGNI